MGESVLKNRLAVPGGLRERWSREAKRTVRRGAGPLITLLTLGVILLARPVLPVPDPGLVLLLTIAIAAVLGGIGSALVSAGITVVFAAIDASLPGQLFRYAPDQLTRLVVTLMVAPAMAIVVAAIQRTREGQTEHAARGRSDDRQRALTDTATDAIIQIDPSSTIVTANPAAADMFGHPRRDLVGMQLTDLMPESFRERHRAALGRYVETGSRTIPWQAVELTARHASGREFPVEVSFGEYVDGPTRRFSGIVRDISRRKELEAELIQAQKMDAIGQFAGGVAHDFNNMLTVISGYASVLRERARSASGVEAVEAIQTAADQAAALTRQLLAFSRHQELQPTVVDLNAVTGRIQTLLKRVLGADLRLVIRPSPELWMVLADPVQMETVLVNLAANARDAMPTGGELRIETANVQLDGAYTRDHAQVEAGAYVMLAVTDSGTGMDRETVRRIFEPFFTTKEVGRGTGLGLATVYGIVKQSGGHIWVYSEPGFGTTFKVYLPRVEGRPVDAAFAPVRRAGQRRHETILVAEDEPAVRALIVSVLERVGYRVLTANDGLSAKLMLEDPARTFDALVTDVVMPGLSGPQIAEVARARRPGIGLLFVSGYTASALEPRGFGRRDLLEKPFTPAQLEDEVARILDARGPLQN